MRRLPPLALRSVSVLCLYLLGCGAPDRSDPGPLGTPALRAALFDSILAWTADREALSPPKNASLGFDPLEAMSSLGDEVSGADSEEALFYALSRLSNARRDRHLSVALVPGGLRLPYEAGLPAWDRDPPPEPPTAPIRVLPDYGPQSDAYFVADVAEGSGFSPEILAPGDRLIAVNGMPLTDYEAEARPYIRHSTGAGCRWKLAEALPRNSAILPPALRRETLRIEVEKPDGSVGTVSLPYLEPETLQWTGGAEPSYPGFRRSWSSPTFDVFLPDDGQPLLLLQWHRFETSLVADVDRLVGFAQEEGLLDHAVLFDATRSGGGSLGAYAVQRLQPKPFKTTFGTLRISGVTEAFVKGKQAEFREQRIYDSGGPETVDDGTWLMDWLEREVLEDLASGTRVTEPVPFKLAHAPKDSDGILQPAAVGFRGPLVVFSGPNGGSHLDQFMAIVADNDLGPIIGMPAGGYSNTWEWEEVLRYPGTEQPVVGFMWSIGHTIRPNGEILEGNPAGVTHPVPLTSENAGHYYELLLGEAYRYLASVGFEAGG